MKKKPNKNFHIADDFNLNLLDPNVSKKIQNFLNMIYQNGIILTIIKPTRFTWKTATAVNYITIKNYFESLFKTAIIK